MYSLASIFPGVLLLLNSALAASYSRFVTYDEGDSVLQPILSQSRRTRICSELCMSGLGGTPCGDSCFDLIPTNLPLVGQSSQGSAGNGSSSGASGGASKYNATTRDGACSVLCKNQLGYPLCGCTYDTTKVYAPDFVEICSTYCVDYGYQLYGCQNCTIYLQYLQASSGSSSSSAFNTASMSIGTSLGVDYSLWCKEECSDGNGGAACQCDLLP
ncbi:uncharacterized protein LOC126739532 [Anthonomus grandis grandis]|uniref:uncharacterized protein LOC126739532 n=1 Tax=Anthonomus grandis grandis TaxID=2921223 RepID=UPI002165D867|nr:uncharacterized protein LOC126739532 [Anthonomus grandis grandis]